MAIKLGTENKKQVAIAAGLGVVVLGLVIYTLVNSLGGSTPAPVATTPPPVVQQAPLVRTVNASREAAKAPHLGATLDPTLHFEVMQQTESLEYSGRGRNIFSVGSAPLQAIPKPIAPIRPTNAQTAYAAPAPPPPPPIDLKFFGFASQQSGTRKAFLLHGDDVFIAAEGDVVDHRYKVVKISPFSIQMEDLPYHDTQTISLTAN